MPDMRLNLRLCFLLFLIVILAACTSTPSTVSGTSSTLVTRTSVPTSVPTAVPGGANCQPASPVLLTPDNVTPVAGISLLQVQGRAPGGELWALSFGGWPLHAHQQIKIVWRMTGSGQLQLVAHGPGGQIVQPADFVPHGGSNWNRPGGEWGSTFTFPASGCWDIHATRDDLSGDIWLMVQ